MIEKLLGDIPEGSAFLDLSALQQDNCAALSRKQLAHLPRETLLVYENLGTLLSLLDRMASCFWGCHGKEHVIENLVGRSVSTCRAALRLISFGHYDESLALIRGIAEIGNLMWLFYISPAEMRLWLDIPEKERRAHYSPAAVRKAIEAGGSVVPHDQSEYSWLCEVGVHPTPNNRPQAHNQHGIPTVGGIYQELGQTACLSRLASTLASVGGPAAKLAILERQHAEAIMGMAIRIVEGLAEIDKMAEPRQSSDDLLPRTKWVDQNIRRKDETS